ncbi:MurR/RpiR family transcriptional regulator [Pseudothauera rhizosphaerae]|uniref:MurR/RpiR family transcriptional regulator n=1 Tax=Pseudothauera rhizosphaerae TaxID=2565932 RepID=A0A4S4AR45_9RHOO|nr:MurR/RpiR family transcriptional regulator [Pseudothauera rhizosphaerae]THF62241.1 MurR/RpiR family transcriptional regulator [Pseudothauera rhizosphaerae]
MTPKPAKRFRPIDERIEALTEPLPDSERKLAELLAAQPALLATHSATELAQIAASSKAAVTRFIQRLGYESFAAARREAREAQRWGAPAFQAAPDLPAATEEAFGEHLRRDLQNLALTFERLAAGVVEPAVATLARARRIGVVGYRNSHALAQYFARQLVLLKDQVVLLPQPGQTVGEDLAGFGPDDMLVILAFRRRVPIVAEIARHARKAGIPVLVLNDAATPPKEVDATWRIACETRGSAQFDSYAAAMSVLNLLVSALARLPEIQAGNRLREAERLHEVFEEL